MINLVECGDYEYEYRVTLDASDAHKRLTEIFEWGQQTKNNRPGHTFICDLGLTGGPFIVAIEDRDMVTEFILRFG